MPQFILDIITAQGWSIRYLAELTGLSYSGIRDYLHGRPNRLSGARIQRVYDALNLHSGCGLLKQDTVYLWRVELEHASLAALDRVLRVMLEIEPYPADLSDDDRPESRYKFVALPFIGGGIDMLPAPHCVLYWHRTYLLIQWQLPSRPVRQVSSPHSLNNADSNLPTIYPNLTDLMCAVWAENMEVSVKRLSGIPLTPSQQTLLKSASISTDPLSIETLDRWMCVAPVDDPDWGSAQQNKPQWTWERVLAEIQLRYQYPEQAAKALKLR